MAGNLMTGGPLVVGQAADPRYPDRISGGSSGGSVAAVAPGIVPVTLGTDTGGPIRLPAGWCGVMGHRPTHGLVPMTGVVPLSPGLDAVGTIAGTVAVIVTAMSVLSGRDMTASSNDRPVGAIGFCFEGSRRRARSSYGDPRTAARLTEAVMLSAQRVHRSTRGAASRCLSTPLFTFRFLASDSVKFSDADSYSGDSSHELTDREEGTSWHGALIRNEGATGFAAAPDRKRRGVRSGRRSWH